MKDPIKKFEELQSLTEGIFEGLFDRIKTPPSVQQSAALKAYREKFQIRYKIVGSNIRKEYNAMELIQAYESGEIDENTELVQVGIKNPKPAKFEEFMKYEPYKSNLKDIKNQKSNSHPEYDDKIYIVFTHFPKNRKIVNKPLSSKIRNLANYLKKNSSLEKFIKIYENGKWVPLQSSSIFPEITNFKLAM